MANRYWPAVGGMEIFLHHLAGALADTHDVTVLARRVDDGPNTRLSDCLERLPPFAPNRDGEVRVEQLRFGTGRRLAMAPLLGTVTPGLRRYAYGRGRRPLAAYYARVAGPVLARAGGAPDVIHAWGPDLLASACVEAGRLLDLPVVMTPVAHPGQWGYDPGSVAAFRAAAGIGALLGVDRQFYVDLGVDPAGVEVCGVCSPGLRSGGGAALRAARGIDGPLVLFVGVRRPYKGVDVLCDAAPLVAERHPTVCFAFVGPGPAVPDAGAARVIDAGAVPAEELDAWVDAADVVCLPSANEILPVSILEAWSLGTPVVTSDIATLSELVGATGGGVVAPRRPDALAAALVGLLDDPAAGRRMGESGRAAWQARYTPARVAERYAAMYERVIGIGGGRRRRRVGAMRRPGGTP